MKLNKSYLIAISLLTIIAIWFLVNNIGKGEAPVGQSQADIQAERLEKIPTVQIRSITAEEHENVLSLYGQTEAAREVMIKAQTAGPIAQTPIAEGRRVNRGALVCRQAVEARQARVGDYLAPGQACGLLVELSPLKVKIQLTETQLPLVKPGDMAEIALATGETVQGQVDFIEAKADPATRTFIGEISVGNPEYALKAGVTATVKIKSGKALAQRIPSNILTLDDNGTVGVRYVDRRNIVRFADVNIIDETATAAWVTGLPDQTDIIIEGQDFVAIGMTVDPQANYNIASQ